MREVRGVVLSENDLDCFQLFPVTGRNMYFDFDPGYPDVSAGAIKSSGESRADLIRGERLESESNSAIVPICQSVGFT